MVLVGLTPPEISLSDLLSAFALCLAPVSASPSLCKTYVTKKDVLEAVQDDT